MHGGHHATRSRPLSLRAGLGAAWHLAKSGYAVDVLEAGPHPGGLVAGWQTPGGRSVEVGIHGFWRAPCSCSPTGLYQSSYLAITGPPAVDSPAASAALAVEPLYFAVPHGTVVTRS